VLCAPLLQDKLSGDLRGAAAGLLASICRAGGAVLWSSTGYYADEALKAAVAALDDAGSVSHSQSRGVCNFGLRLYLNSLVTLQQHQLLKAW
jgi:hypothetical protein